MYKLMKFLILTSFLIMCSSFSPTKNNQGVKQGNVIYSFEGGKIQCESQIDSTGKTTILLKSLDKKTTVTFSNIYRSNNSYVLKAIMMVKADTDLCASWTNMQEVNITLNPLKVKNITLTGKVIYESDQFKVLTPV